MFIIVMDRSSIYGQSFGVPGLSIQSSLSLLHPKYEVVVEESGLEGVSIEYTGGDRGWAGDVPKTSLEVGRLLSTGFEPDMASEDAIRHTARALISEIGL